MAEMAPLWQCPICSAGHLHPVSRCSACRAVLTLSDLDALINNGDVDEELVRKAIDGYQNAAGAADDFHIQCHLGLALLNLHRLDEALNSLRAASRLRPNNRVLQAVVEKLAQRSLKAKAPVPQVVGKDLFSRARILVVDDSRVQLLYVSRILEKHGWRVITASDGLEALDRVRGVDLILLDIHMPGMDGYQVCKLVRENPETSHVPIVLLSGREESWDNERGRLAGAETYLTKPCKPELLLQVVEKYRQPTAV